MNVTGLGTELFLLPQSIDMCLERKSILQPEVEIRRESLGISINLSKICADLKKYLRISQGVVCLLTDGVLICVKFLFFKNKEGIRIKRFQYTAIDDCTRIRALKIYKKYTQANAIDFVNYVVKKFPFRIHTIRTDNGHEFQNKFNWHVSDIGLKHAYIKPGTPRLNGKVERSHLTDKREFYQLLDYKDDVDLREKLGQWEDYYNFLRPHSSHMGKTPYEKLRRVMV